MPVIDSFREETYWNPEVFWFLDFSREFYEKLDFHWKSQLSIPSKLLDFYSNFLFQATVQDALVGKSWKPETAVFKSEVFHSGYIE